MSTEPLIPSVEELIAQLTISADMEVSDTEECCGERAYIEAAGLNGSAGCIRALGSHRHHIAMHGEDLVLVWEDAA